MPLVIFRIAFGVLMFISVVRFLLRGWVYEFYIAPEFHFTYLGFGWVKPLPEPWIYGIFLAMALLALGIALGLFYRFSTMGFFLLFTYVELLDKTYYLNHYYFVSLLSFLLIFLPLNKSFALDTRLGIAKKSNAAPTWVLYAIRSQLALVYFFAGLAKLEPDWLFQAMPLRIWLRANTDLPLLGQFFDEAWMAYAMSWAGAFYDLTIVFFLLWRKTRFLAYLAVIGFHVMTALLFHIGMFPWIMIVSTLIFFSEKDYLRVINIVRHLFRKPILFFNNQNLVNTFKPNKATLVLTIISLSFLFQISMALRHNLYPSNVLWSEEGFRFSWRVMLVEKTGLAIFTVKDPSTNKIWEVYPCEYLTPQQEKQMSFQPDMILQFAHFIENKFRAQGYEDLEVYADVYVSLNGRSSTPYINPKTDLTKENYNLAARDWVLPIQKN